MKPARKHNAIRSKMTREDGTVVSFRSLAERRHAEMLEMQRNAGLVASWAYESRKFHFPDQKSGSVSYTPDFVVQTMMVRCVVGGVEPVVEFHEIKGFWQSKDTEKLVKMARYFPEIFVTTFGAPMPAKARERMEAARARTLREREVAERRAAKAATKAKVA